MSFTNRTAVITGAFSGIGVVLMVAPAGAGRGWQPSRLAHRLDELVREVRSAGGRDRGHPRRHHGPRSYSHGDPGAGGETRAGGPAHRQRRGRSVAGADR